MSCRADPHGIDGSEIYSDADPHDPLEAAHHAATIGSGTPDGALRKDCVMGDKSQKNKDKKQKTAMKAKAAKAAKARPAQQ